MAVQIPSALIPALRAALTSQGYSASIVTNSGDIDAGALLASTFDTVEFRSRLTPTVRVPVHELVNSPPSPFARLASPAVIATGGKAGRFEIAPFGVPSEGTGAFVSVAIIGAIFLAGFAVGRKTGH